MHDLADKTGWGKSTVGRILKSAKTVNSMGKVMRIMFIARSRMLLVHMVPKGRIMPAIILRFKTCLVKCHKKETRVDKWNRKFSVASKLCLSSYWERNPARNGCFGVSAGWPSPISPDLTQLNIKYFSKLKNYSLGNRFHSRDAILSFIKTLPQKWFEEMWIMVESRQKVWSAWSRVLWEEMDSM